MRDAEIDLDLSIEVHRRQDEVLELDSKPSKSLTTGRISQEGGLALTRQRRDRSRHSARQAGEQVKLLSEYALKGQLLNKLAVQ